MVALIHFWIDHGWAVAVAGTILLANGGMWHEKDRAYGVVQHTSITMVDHFPSVSRKNPTSRCSNSSG